MHLSAFTRQLLLLFTGPIAWALHFVGSYALVGVVCARADGATWLAPALLGASLATCAAIGAILLRAGPCAEGTGSFVLRVGRGLGWLSVTAILWETAAVYLVPACTSVA